MPAPDLTFVAMTAIAVFAAAFVYASYTDIKEMRITNKTCAIALGAYLPFVLTLIIAGQWQVIGMSVIIALIVFSVTAFMNAKGALGGGDVKLMTVLALWAGPQYAVDTFFIVALCGGVFSLIFLLFTVLRRAKTATVSGRDRKAIEQRPIPYGPGITIAGLFLSSQLILNA